MNNMEKRIYKVEGMKCGHCKATVEEALRALDGVVSAEVSLDEACVAVEMDCDKVSDSDIRDAVENSGRFEVL